jgi:hypothetical protein
MLEQVEIHRLRLTEATTLAVNAFPIGDSVTKLIEGLHCQASERYRQFQLGFRAYVRQFLPKCA